MDANTGGAVDWYERRHELEEGMTFRDSAGYPLKLDRRVPGDGTKWYAATWSEWSGSWCYDDTTIEPGDLAERIEDPALATGGHR